MGQAPLCLCGLEGHPQSALSDSDTSQIVLFPGDHAAMWGCLPTCSQSPLRGHCGSPSLHTSAVPACTVPLSNAKAAAKAGARAGEITLKTVGSFPPGLLCGMPQGPLGRAGKKTVAGVVRLTGAVAGWHNKGGDGGSWEKKRDSGWF